MTEGLLQVMYITPDRILDLRQALHCTQEEFARGLSVSILTISRWEHGHIRPHLKNVRKLLKLEEEVAAQRGEQK